ncbi:unnamed protein product [Protopolystoma xenopodis]|uniref:Transmembrane 9 superfamily member n=1 Tax=Protopolystoma xenopodis TaxID=117903 RepID=A0A3S5CJC8_9PLAT|nr:unnamed protein product [Protopolystoma xenopodis]
MLYPTIVFGVGFVLNFFLIAKGSSASVPFTTMLALFALWWCISVPLVFFGFYFGYRKRPYEQPVRTNQIPRAVPDQKWHHNLFISTLFTGMVPFGAAFIELFYIFTAIWERHFYYLFGFLFIVFIIIVISVAEIAVIVVYFQLCHEDYRWWWRTFITSGGSALYVFGYTVFFYLTKLEITEFVPSVIYFGYSLLMVITSWILTGAIGVYAALIFLQKIYAAIKID